MWKDGQKLTSAFRKKISLETTEFVCAGEARNNESRTADGSSLLYAFLSAEVTKGWLTQPLQI
jgi:hypothetical protein